MVKGLVSVLDSFLPNSYENLTKFSTSSNLGLCDKIIVIVPTAYVGSGD